MWPQSGARSAEGCSFPFPSATLFIPPASPVPGGINQALLRQVRGSEVELDPVGLPPDNDGKWSGQLRPASALLATNLDQTGQLGRRGGYRDEQQSDDGPHVRVDAYASAISEGRANEFACVLSAGRLRCVWQRSRPWVMQSEMRCVPLCLEQDVSPHHCAIYFEVYEVLLLLKMVKLSACR